MTGTEMGRSERKRQAITDAAQKVFLSKGFRDTTMDEIAAKAQVSKQTVYKQFANKEQLFAGVLVSAIEASGRKTDPLLAAIDDSDDLHRNLTTFARAHIADVVQPHVVELRRIVIANAERFGDLARMWHERAVQATYREFAALFRRLQERRLLRVDDPELAAQTFNWLLLATPLHLATFTGEIPTDADVRRYADEGVRVFLAAYGVD